MIGTLVLTLCLAASGKPAAKLEAGQAAFNRGDFAGAVKLLDQAAADAQDAAQLSRIWLLKGQAYGAQQDFSRAEDAFSMALGFDPEASLDPSRIDPALVKLLDGLKDRFKGELTVTTTPPGSQVKVDGIAHGVSPAKVPVSAGRHAVEVRSADGVYVLKQDVVVGMQRTVPLSLVFESTGVPPPLAEPGAMRPVADIRATLNPGDLASGVGVEIGGGVEGRNYRATLNAQVVPHFALTPRGAFVVPIVDKFAAYVQLELPLVFAENTVNFGLGGAGGAEFSPTRWLGAFLEVGGRHFFTGAFSQGRENNRAIIEAGIRLRLP